MFDPCTRVDHDVAVAELAVGEHGDRGERGAPRLPAEEHAHLQLAHVELEIAGEPVVALGRDQRDDREVDSFRLDGAVDQVARPVVVATREAQMQLGQHHTPECRIHGLRALCNEMCE